MRSSGRPVLATSSAARLELAHEARLRRHDSRSDGSWDLSGLCRSAPDLQVSASGDAKGSAKRSPRNKARCMMMPDPTPPYHARHFCLDCREKVLAVIGWMAPAPESALSPAPPESITTPEDTLRGAGIRDERLALYQRRMSSLLARRA